MRRYTVTLRDVHPQEHAVAQYIRALPPRRRQDRIRELLRKGLACEAAAPIFVPGTGSETSTRIDVYVNETYEDDTTIIESVEIVAPRLRHEFLRSLMIRGLLGDALETVENERTKPQALTSIPRLEPKAKPAAKATPKTKPAPAAQPAANPAPIVQDVDFVLPLDETSNENETTTAANDEEPPKLRSELRGLFM